MLSVSVHGVSAHVSETGEGEPVVLLHSGAGESRDWRRFSAALDDYRCAALDFYGCGRTPPWPGKGTFTIDDQAHLVTTLAREIGSPVHLCGHSYGAAIALRVAVTHPHLLTTVSLIEPQCYRLLHEIGDPLYEVSASLWNAFCAAFERGEPEVGWRRFIDFYNGDGFWDRLRPEMRAGFLSASPIERWSVLFSNPTTLDDVAKVKVPVLVVCGENTTAPERRMCEIIAGAAPHATLTTVAGAGHMSPITHPKEVATRVAKHLTMADSKSPSGPRSIHC
jgi:lipase